MKFTIPTVEILKLAVKDVIAVSGGNGGDGEWGNPGNED